MQSSPQVLAICVNWNGGDLLRETLAALDQSDYPALRVLVVDSASTDQSTDCLPEGVQLLSLSENLGYAAALNRALRHAEEESAAPPSYYLLLNNDIRLFPDCVNRLVAAAEHSKPCICGPRILQWNLPDRLEASWGEIRWNHVLAHFRHQNSTDDLSDTAPSEVELLLGCALLVHRDVVAQVGPWDENFFLYHEEIDYLFRAAKRGIPAIFVPAAGAYHWGGWGTPDALRKVFGIRRNTVYFLRKHHATLGQWVRFTASLLASLAWNLATLRWPRGLAIYKGVRGGFQMELPRV